MVQSLLEDHDYDPTDPRTVDSTRPMMGVGGAAGGDRAAMAATAAAAAAATATTAAATAAATAAGELPPLVVVHVAGGWEHTLILTHNGKLFSCGAG